MMRSILMMMTIKVLVEERGNCEAENCDQDKKQECWDFCDDDDSKHFDDDHKWDLRYWQSRKKTEGLKIVIFDRNDKEIVIMMTNIMVMMMTMEVLAEKKQLRSCKLRRANLWFWWVIPMIFLSENLIGNDW